MAKTQIRVKVVNGDTNTVLLEKVVKSVRDIDKLVRDITDYKVVLVPASLYDYLKDQGLKKEELKALTDEIMKETITDLQTYVSALMSTFRATDKSISTVLYMPRTVDVVITYYLTRHLVLGVWKGQPLSMMTGLGVLRKEVEVSSKGFYLTELERARKIFGSGVVYCKDGKTTLYYYWDFEESKMSTKTEIDYLPKVFEG